MAPSLVGILAAAAPQLFGLWQGMDAKAQRQLLEVGKQFLPLAGLPTEATEKVMAVMDDDSDLMAKFSRLASDPEILAAWQERGSSTQGKEPAPREVAVSCPNCKTIKFISV